MSPVATVRLIAAREVRQRLRSRLFVWTTLGLSGLFVLLALLPTLGGLLDVVRPDPDEEPEATAVAVVGGLAPVQRAALEDVVGVLDEVDASDASEAERLVRDREVDFAVIDVERILEAPPEGVFAVGGGRAARAAEALAVATLLGEAGFTTDAVGEVLAVRPLPVEVVGDFDPGEQVAQLVLANLGVVFLFAVLTLYATLIVNGVIEEKGSRVVELLVEAVPVRQLMAGKILGLGAVGLGQTLALFAPATAVLVVTGAVPLPGRGLVPIGLVLVWFLLGYGFYSVVSAALGSLVSRPEEAQAVLTPASLLMVAGYLVGFFTINAPDGALATAAGWIPPTAPYVMLVRQLLGSPTTVEIAGAVVGVLAGTALVGAVATRVYEGGILRTGARVRLRDAWRTARD